MVGAALALVLACPAVSYARALGYPGEATVGERTVEWVRDNGGSPIIDLLENLWYRNGPVAAVPQLGDLPTATSSGAVGAAAAPPPLPALAGAMPVPGEGMWMTSVRAASGAPVVLTTFVRPDPHHPSVVTGVARMVTTALSFRSIAGTAQPVADPSRPGTIPAELRPGLAATFNSGFKLAEARGGFRSGTWEPVSLRTGAASFVIRSDGSATVGQWGRDAGPGADVVSVRQNLDLVVDQGRPVPGLDLNGSGRWGSASNQLQYTWRSGVGVDADGSVVYVGGNHLTLATLATALVEAGTVRGMELDVHPDKVDYFTYVHASDGSLTPHRLLPDMPGRDDRYLVQDLRDFFVATLR